MWLPTSASGKLQGSVPPRGERPKWDRERFRDTSEQTVGAAAPPQVGFEPLLSVHAFAEKVCYIIE